jgi:hypothetical protein
MNKLVIIIGCLITLNVYSRIIETDDLNDIMPYVDSNTLVVFDIDDTIARPSQMLGTDAWFRYLLHKYEQHGVDIDTALDNILPIVFQVHQQAMFLLVQPDTPSLIEQLQHHGIRTIALTSRSPILARRTVIQLNDLGIDFTRNQFIDYETLLPTMVYAAKYLSGIIFSSENDKGPLLIKFLNFVDHHPKRIIFIDDKRKYLDCVEQSAIQQGIEFFGFHYTRVKKECPPFDPQIAHQQLRVFLQKQEHAFRP